MARPTDYNQEVIDKAYEYLGDDPSTNYQSHGHAIPSIVGMCRVIKRARTTLYRWAEEEDNEFKYILAQSNEDQEFTLLNGALKNELNPNIAKLALGKHGYHDKQDTNIAGQLDTLSTYKPEVHRFDGSTDSEDS